MDFTINKWRATTSKTFQGTLYQMKKCFTPVSPVQKKKIHMKYWNTSPNPK